MDEEFWVITKVFRFTLTLMVCFSNFNFGSFFAKIKNVSFLVLTEIKTACGWMFILLLWNIKNCCFHLRCFMININCKVSSRSSSMIWLWYNDWILCQIVDKLIWTIEWKLVSNNINRVYALAAIQLIHNSWNEILKM